MPVDKFGRMSDLKTKDTGVSLTYINNNYVRSDGKTPLTGSLDMRGNTIYNVADPVNPQDVVTKVYVDNTKGSGVIGRKTKDGVSIKENMDFLGKQRIKNLPNPVNDHDAVTKEYVDSKGNFLELDNPFKFKDNIYEAKDNINLKGFKISEVSLPSEDGDVATKKYVDDLQTQNVDEKGNIKFSRNINLDRNRIFSMKEPTKPSEGANKKYVDDTITKRLQEEKDNFLPQDPATKEYVDEAIKRVAGGDLLVSKEGVFIKANGHYRATAPLDIDNHKMENLPDPVDDKDAVNKKYIDEIVENLTLKQGLVRENGGFNLLDSYINMNFNNIRNVGLPKDESDAVPRRFVDSEINTVMKQVQNQFKELNHLVSVSASCHEHLKYGDYPFTFGGPILNRNIFNLDKYNGFLVPADGFIKHFAISSTGLILNIPPNTISTDVTVGPVDGAFNEILKLYRDINKPTKLFNLIKIKYNFEIEIIGSVFLFLQIGDSIDNKYLYTTNTNFEFRPDPKYLNKEKNFICPVRQGEIINIRSEYTETIIKNDESFISDKGYIIAFPYNFVSQAMPKKNYFLHLATLTFLFKERSFPEISDLAPL